MTLLWRTVCVCVASVVCCHGVTSNARALRCVVLHVCGFKLVYSNYSFVWIDMLQCVSHVVVCAKSNLRIKQQSHHNTCLGSCYKKDVHMARDPGRCRAMPRTPPRRCDITCPSGTAAECGVCRGTESSMWKCMGGSST